MQLKLHTSLPQGVAILRLLFNQPISLCLRPQHCASFTVGPACLIFALFVGHGFQENQVLNKERSSNQARQMRPREDVCAADLKEF